MSRILVLVSGLIGAALIAFGVYGLVATATFMKMTGLVPAGVAGLNEARAIYCGLFWAMGALIFQALVVPRVRQPVLFAMGVLFAGFLAGRIASIAMDGYDPALTPAIVFELVAAIVLLVTSRMAAPADSAR